MANKLRGNYCYDISKNSFIKTKERTGIRAILALRANFERLCCTWSIQKHEKSLI